MSYDRRTVLRSIGGALGATAVVGSAGTAAAGRSYTNHGYGGFDYWKYVPGGPDASQLVWEFRSDFSG